MAAGHRALARRVALLTAVSTAPGSVRSGRVQGLIMRDTTLMQMALGLTPPWTVTGSDFDAAAGRIDIRIDFPAGSRFACPSCGAAGCAVHDTERKSWRHLNFFQHQAYLNARVPRVRCDKCGIRIISVPWAELAKVPSA